MENKNVKAILKYQADVLRRIADELDGARHSDKVFETTGRLEAFSADLKKFGHEWHHEINRRDIENYTPSAGR